MVDHVNGVESDRADRQQLRHSGQVWCVSVSLLKMIPIKRVPSVIISQPLSPRPSLLSSLFSQVRQSSLFQARLLQTRQSLRTPPQLVLCLCHTQRPPHRATVSSQRMPSRGQKFSQLFPAVSPSVHAVGAGCVGC